MQEPVRTDVVARVRGFLKTNLLYAQPDAEIGERDRLLERGIIDSMGVIELVQFLESEFALQVRDTEIIEDNLGSLAAIAEFVRHKGRADA